MNLFDNWAETKAALVDGLEKHQHLNQILADHQADVRAKTAAWNSRPWYKKVMYRVRLILWRLKLIKTKPPGLEGIIIPMIRRILPGVIAHDLMHGTEERIEK